MIKHTPGPWKVVTTDEGQTWVCPEGTKPYDMHSYFIGDLEDTCGECFANAYLMAAAPKLLEVCEEVQKRLIDKYMEKDKPDQSLIYLAEILLDDVILLASGSIEDIESK